MAEIITDTSEGITTQFEIVAPNKFNVLRTQDVQGIIDLNKADQNDSSFRNGFTPSGDLKHVARIPRLMFHVWWKEAGRPAGGPFGKAMNEIVRKKLNDPDNKFLRTGLGEV